MVGRRNRNLYPPPKDTQPGKQDGNGDLESGTLGNKPRKGQKPALWRFRDAAHTAVGIERREALKQKLLHGIDREGLEKFRKSDEELKEIKNKKVRAFYENQNERLNDWVEIDAIVMSLADDVLDSMDPDPDHDGHNERGGGLNNVHGNIWDFLPEEAKQKRQQAEKKAKWAININVIANVLLLIAKVRKRFAMGNRMYPLTQPTGYRSILLLVPLPHRVPRRLRSRSALHSDRLEHEPARPMASEIA